MACLSLKNELLLKTEADSPFRQISKMFSLYPASLKYMEIL